MTVPKSRTKDGLTAKQRRFVEEYLVDLNGTQAAIRAGYELNAAPPSSGFYVYALADARGGPIFYVGKGRCRRVLAHVPNARKMLGGNAARNLKINEILGTGGEVVHFILDVFESESRALCSERDLITRLGLENLTNIAPGHLGERDRNKLRAQEALSRIMSRDELLRTRAPGPRELGLYDRIISELRKVASEGWVSTYTFRNGELVEGSMR